MINSYRASFNEQFTTEQYASFLKELEKGFSEIPFRVAESPVFLPALLKDQLIAAGEEMWMCSFIGNLPFRWNRLFRDGLKVFRFNQGYNFLSSGNQLIF